MLELERLPGCRLLIANRVQPGVLGSKNKGIRLLADIQVLFASGDLQGQQSEN
jgi:hypothetical protein